jgi:hypothetical protein
MGKRKRVPEDLMGSILGEDPGVSIEEQTLPKPRYADQETPSPAGEGAFSWEERPERIGIAFNLSKQLTAELERLRQELRPEEDVRPSRSEIVETALRIAVEDVRERGRESELFRRLNRQTAGATGRATEEVGRTTRRDVDESGFIVETIYGENGEIIDEDVVATVSDLPVETEYVDEAGRLVSLARDEAGNIFEWVMDEELNILEARLVQDADQNAR